MMDQLEEDLCGATSSGNVSSAATLLKQGADVNARDRQGYTPLHWTVTAGHNRPDRVGVAELLLTWGADPNVRDDYGDTPLALAAAKKPHTSMILLLLARGADPNTHRDAKYGGYTPLHPAAYHGDSVAVEYLLLHGADANARTAAGRTPLHDAALKNHAEIARLLLSAGADPNIQDNAGRTPLQVAHAHGSVEVAMELEI